MRNDTGKNCNLAKITQDLGEHWNEQREIGERLGVDHKTISNDLGKNCSFAKIPQDLGEQWNEQGVAVGTVNSMFNNCNLAKIEQDLGEQWNEQVSLDTNNCNLAKICNHPSPRAWARRWPR